MNLAVATVIRTIDREEMAMRRREVERRRDQDHRRLGAAVAALPPELLAAVAAMSREARLAVEALGRP